MAPQISPCQSPTPTGTAVDVDVAFDPGSSIADASDIGGYATQTVSFPASASDGDTRAVPVTLTDDSEVESDETASFTLQNLTTSGSTVLGVPSDFGLTIEDNDGGPKGDFIISQYVETDDGSEPKGIELWNATGGPIDFSNTPLAVKRYSNGSSSFTTDLSKNTGTLGPGEVLVAGRGELESYLNNNITGANFEELNTVGLFNGNDAIEITLGGTTTDVFGTIGDNPGNGTIRRMAWTGGGVSTTDSNIQLLPGVVTGGPPADGPIPQPGSRRFRSRSVYEAS